MKALLALAVMSTQQFNLNCAGDLTSMGHGGNTVTAYSRVLRIDLASKRWCADECRTVDPIASVEPGRLLLKDRKTDTPREYWFERESVDRTTGEHSSAATDGPYGSYSRFRKGQCEKAPFTGFTTGPTKF